MASIYDRIGKSDKDIAKEVMDKLCPDCFGNALCTSRKKGDVTGCPKFFKYRLDLYKEAVKDDDNC